MVTHFCNEHSINAINIAGKTLKFCRQACWVFVLLLRITRHYLDLLGILADRDLYKIFIKYYNITWRVEITFGKIGIAQLQGTIWVF